jgi:uncharacterized protein YndB with AHSA1/START domain
MGIVQCEVLELEPHKRLRDTWRSGTGPRVWTVVTCTLTPTASGGTPLTLEHSGFVPAKAFACDGARTGWRRMVGRSLMEVLADL